MPDPLGMRDTEGPEPMDERVGSESKLVALLRGPALRGRNFILLITWYVGGTSLLGMLVRE
jgi:hypothetical protein